MKSVSIDSRGGHNRFRFDTDIFKTWSPSMAYVLGYIFADGAIEDVRRSSRTCYLAISSIDISILEQIKKVLNSKHKLYKRKSQVVTFPNGKFKTKEQYLLRIGSKIVFNDLIKFGLTPKKSLTIKFPTIPPEYLSYFIRGYFDGDGCLHLKKDKYPLVIFTSGSLRFLKGLSDDLYKAGIAHIREVTINDYGSSTYFQLRYGVKESVNILNFIYKNPLKSPFLERKYLIYQKYLSVPHRVLKSKNCFYLRK